MKKAFQRMAVWALLPLLAGCMLEGGNGSETTNHLAGKVESSDGSPAARVIVSAVPATFNPLSDTLDPGLADTTDAQGRFVIPEPAVGSYHLQFHGPDGNRAWKGGVNYRKGRLDVGLVRLQESGAIEVELPGSLRISGGFIFIPGSTYRTHLGEASKTLLDSLPGARFPALHFSRGSRDTSVPIARDIEVRSADTAGLSIGDSIRLPREALFRLRTTAAGADVTEDVIGFPLLLRLDSSSFDFRLARAEYAALAFYQDGRVLPHEIERWDSLGRKAEIWIRADVKGNAESQHLLMRWGKAGDLPRPPGIPPFDTGAGFAGAYHFAIEPCGCRNSANAALNIEPMNFDGDERIEGVIGPALRLDSGRVDSSYVNDVMNLGELKIGAKVTFSAWVRLDDFAHGRYSSDYVLGQYRIGEPSPRIFYYLFLGSDSTLPFFRAESGNRTFGYPSEVTIPVGTNPLVPGSWTLVHGTFDGSTLHTYVNGERIHSQSASFPGNPVLDGLQTLLSFAYGGSVDEVRVERIPRSPAWIKLSYENQKTGQSLIERVR